MQTNNKVDRENMPNQMNTNAAGGQNAPPGEANGNQGQRRPQGPNIFNILLVIFLITFLLNVFLVTTLLGGRAAELIQFGEVTTGAANDIERATKLARGMVTQYGMSDAFGPMGLESAQSQYLDGRNVRNCAEETGAAVDEEVRKILEQCQQSAIQLLRENEGALQRISEYLLEKENITGEEFMRLLKQEEPAA